MSITASMPARCSPRLVAGMPPPPQATTIEPEASSERIALELDHLERLRRGHDAPPAAAGVVDDLPAAVALELARLLLVVERADRLGRLREGRVVLGHQHVGQQADDRPAGDGSSSLSISAPISAWVCATAR